MLRNKLFKAIAILVLTIGVLSAMIGIRMIKSRTVNEAQNRVRLDLSSAWSVYRSQQQRIQTITELVASKDITQQICDASLLDEEAARSRLEVICRKFGLNFLTIVSMDGKVLFRAMPPYNEGDFKLARTFVSKALAGEQALGTVLFSREELKLEADGLAETAFFTLEETPRSRSTERIEESRGMVILSAVPVKIGAQVVGAIYGGVLINRNDQFIDLMKSSVYEDQEYNGIPFGTATVFLMDSRVATTVRLPNGNRALGTRVSKEVAARVLDNALSWVGRAFVVKDWYLSAYDPVLDFDGRVIGMLYVGVLERPYRELGRQIIARYAFLVAFGLAAALVVAYMVAQRVSRPIHMLAEASARMKHGDWSRPAVCGRACEETEGLVTAFNEMADSLQEREEKLKDSNEKLEELNSSLTRVNRSYMDMLGFVSHELKSPVASIMNYIFLLREQKLGDLNERQQKAVHNIEHSSRRIVEMVRHYLNLSRIENSELRPVLNRMDVMGDVIEQVLDTNEAEVAKREMNIECTVPAPLYLYADLNMVQEVFENLVSNAIKYGRDGGKIWIHAKEEGRMTYFTVGNEGEGLQPGEKEELFQKFSRLEGKESVSRQKGTGLGLFITRHIVEAHGGTIEVESQAGEWVEFRFGLPRYNQNEEKA